MTSIADQTNDTKHSDQFLADSDSFILADIELSRLAVVLYLTNLLRLWLVGHEQSRLQHGGAGWIDQAELIPAYERITGEQIGDRHLRRLLSRGDGIFWTRCNDRLYLAGIARLAEELVILAGLRGLAGAIATNRPGNLKSVWLNMRGSHQQFEANIYAAWFAGKRDTTIARETLESLFGRDQTTLRRWESTRLRGLVDVIPGYATTRHISELPSDGATWNKRAQEYVWQLPNTYVSTARQSVHNGQRRKVQRAVDGPTIGAGADTHRRYFDTYKAMRNADRRHQARGPRYYFRGHWRGNNFFSVGLGL